MWITFSAGKINNMCSATLTEHQPLKRGRQISQHLLIHPNLQFIIVPQPCRKRSVTLGDGPAAHLSNFTLLSSPSVFFFWLTLRFPQARSKSVHIVFTHTAAICLPLLCSFVCMSVPVFSPYGYDSVYVKHGVITANPMQWLC